MAAMDTAQVLVVDRDSDVGRTILAFLRDRGYRAEWVDDAEKAFNRLDDTLFDVLVTELHIHRVDGMRLMAVAKERNPDICVVFMTEKPDIQLATEAMRQGAYDFQIKPLNLEKLEAVVQHGLAYQRLVAEQVELKRRLDERYGLGSLTGRSRQMIQVYNAVRQIGPTHEPVLVFGEPGTGKDLIAQAIHNSSPLRDEAFVKFDCVGIPEALAEVELFGHAASGGKPARPGRFQLADGGTFYLDSVDALTPRLQEGVLQVLQQGAVERPGDGKRIPVVLRLIAATNQRLDALVRSGAFREDLCAGLTAVAIEAPALRARREDIPLLVKRVMSEAAERHTKTVPGMTRTSMNLLMRYDWPGNVRELCNVVEGMVATSARTGPLEVQDIPEYLRRSAAPETSEIRVPTGTRMRDIERIAIEETMRVCGYDKQQCAKTLGIGLRTLYRKLKSYDIH